MDKHRGELFGYLPVPAILVLDNYQEVGAEVPKGARIIVASRAEPPPHAARHLAKPD